MYAQRARTDSRQYHYMSRISLPHSWYSSLEHVDWSKKVCLKLLPHKRLRPWGSCKLFHCANEGYSISSVHSLNQTLKVVYLHSCNRAIYPAPQITPPPQPQLLDTPPYSYTRLIHQPLIPLLCRHNSRTGTLTPPTQSHLPNPLPPPLPPTLLHYKISKLLPALSSAIIGIY